MALEGILLTGVILFVLIVISALPLYIAVKLLGGKASIIKVFIVNIIVGILVPIVNSFINWFGGLIAFIVLLFIYKKMFDLGWFRAFVAWVLQFIVLVGLIFIAGLFGLSLVL
ncbi:hypothetical protein ACFLZ6_01595 [Nanoarchaeota archaeon]